MLGLWASIWPLAIGAAISPTITLIAIALLNSDARGRHRVLAYWAGAAASLVVWVIIVSSFMWQLVASATADVERYSSVIDLGLGALLLGVGAWRVLTRKRASPAGDSGSKHDSRWDVRSLGEGSLRRQFWFGMVMQGRNVTSVLLFCAAQQHIDAASLPLWQKAIVTASVIGIATASIWLVVVVPARLRGRVSEWMQPARGWLSTRSRTIETVVAIGAGLFLIIRSGVTLWF